jgi:hypothetical protein
MLTKTRPPRVRWTTRRSEGGSLSITVTLRPRGASTAAAGLRQATTAPTLIPALRGCGLSYGDIGLCVGSLRGRVWEWQRGVVGVGRARWARLTALRDIVLALDEAGNHTPRGWLFAHNPVLGACPYQRIRADDFSNVLLAARQSSAAL